jgi:hypothetical protein
MDFNSPESNSRSFYFSVKDVHAHSTYKLQERASLRSRGLFCVTLNLKFARNADPSPNIIRVSLSSMMIQSVIDTLQGITSLQLIRKPQGESKF